MPVVIGMLLAVGCLLLWGAGPQRLRSLLPPDRDSSNAASRAWTDGSSARSGPPDPALVLDLLGAALDAGASLEQALGALADAVDDDTARGLSSVLGALALGSTWNAAWGFSVGSEGRAQPHSVLVVVREALDFAGATGAPSAALLYAHAGQLRRRRKRQAEKRAATLGVKLVLPLGVCALPSFVCLGIVPVLYALLPGLG